MVRRPIREYFFPQKVQVCGFSPVCVNMWLFRCPFVMKLLPQPVYSQAKGRSPVYARGLSDLEDYT